MSGTMWPYIYYFNRQGRKGQLCRVLVLGKMNSCLVEFEDGYRMITSRTAIRRHPSRALDQGEKLPASRV